MKTILVVDDEIGILESFKIILKDNYRVLTARNGTAALEILNNEIVHLVILDIIMPGISGMDVLREIYNTHRDVDVIMVTATKTVKTAIEAMKLGASDYVIKPFDVEEIKLIISKTLQSRELTQEVEYLRSEIDRNFESSNIIGKSPAMSQIFDTLIKVAKGNSPVLITGESGTGKELIARAIHLRSQRKNKPFIAVSCPNLPETLLESELFGHEKGAFTNATDKKTGRFELAHGGTLFLDEISEMGLSNQAKLLRVLQEYEFVRVGGTKTISIDTRLIAATNTNLKTAIKKGIFREDLFYRINVVPINLPPLRERKEDIPLLIHHYFQKYKRELNAKVKDIHPTAVKLLEEYHWPGNIRELKNVFERALTLYGDNDVILSENLPLEIRMPGYNASHYPAYFIGLSENESLDKIVSYVEKELIENALQRSNGIQSKAARSLKITRRVLRYKMNKLGISQPE